MKAVDKSGAHLGIARNWITWEASNGEQVTWGSNDILRGITVIAVEELAHKIAETALRMREDANNIANELRKKNLRLEIQICSLQLRLARVKARKTTNE